MMNKYILIIAAVVLIGGLGWYVLTPEAPAQPSQEAPGTMTETEEESSTEPMQITVPLSEQNASGQEGTATFTERGGGVWVILAVSGAPTGVMQPAHVHFNTCADIGGVKYPLTFPVNGESETMLEISMDELLEGMPLSVNVHKSPEEAHIYVACGDIVSP